MTCIVAAHEQTRHRIPRTRQNSGAGPFAKVSRILVQECREHAGTQKTLGTEISYSGTETLAIIGPAWSISGSLVAKLRKRRGDGSVTDIEWIHDFPPAKMPLLSGGHGCDWLRRVPYSLVVGNDLQDAGLVQWYGARRGNYWGYIAGIAGRISFVPRRA